MNKYYDTYQDAVATRDTLRGWDRPHVARHTHQDDTGKERRDYVVCAEDPHTGALVIEQTDGFFR